MYNFFLYYLEGKSIEVGAGAASNGCDSATMVKSPLPLPDFFAKQVASSYDST
jgi:hypothetical protein